MTPVILSRAARLLEDRVVQLEQRIHQGDEGAWEAYVTTVNALVAVLAQATPGVRGELLTTKEMAEKLGIAPKTLLRRKANGQVRPALQLGKRGRAAIRWRGDEVAR